VREGAPSPPSLRSLSNAGDEEDSDERSGYHSNDRTSSTPDDIRKKSASPEPIRPIEEEEVTTSSPQSLPRSVPPPVPSGRPPVPHVRRSIPPPPRASIPSPPRSMSKEEENPSETQSPIVVPTSPQGRKSIGSVRQRSRDGSQDETMQSVIRQAASRPPLPPPSRNVEKEVMDDEDGGK
jgi:hypothetical protein